MPITALPLPVPTTANPTSFDANADTFLAALPTFATEANALEVNVNSLQVSAGTSSTSAAASAASAQALAGAVMFNGATAYTLGQAAISAVNLLTYRRKSAGTSATDPSNDTTNWGPTGLPPVVVVRTAVGVTMSPGVYYIITAALITMTLPASPGAQDLYHYRSAVGLGAASWSLAPGGTNKIEGQTTNFNVNAANARGTLWFDSVDGYVHLGN